MDAKLSQCPGCVAAASKIAELERELARITQENIQLRARLKQLEETVEALGRSAKRQAAPFSRGVPKAHPQKPGRKPGPDYGTHAFRKAPEHIDETHAAPLPEKCPRCGGRLVQTHVDHQYQVEIPRKPIYRQFNIAVGRCTCCGSQVRGRHPLQTSDAVGCCQSQIGPEAQAAVVLLNKELGLSQGKICRFFDTFFGIPLSRGGSCQIMQRAAAACEEHYSQIVTRVQHSPFIVPDETGWRIGGKLAWLHVAVGDVATAYLIVRQRGKEASDLLIGPDYAGKMTHDGWSPYDKYHAADHQTCVGHLLERCKQLLENATEAAALFPRKIKELLQHALECRDLRDAGKLPNTRCIKIAGGMEFFMEWLTTPVQADAANERLAGHLHRHLHQLFTFLREPGIDATNHRAEQAIRPAVVNRKVWGGNRTPAGAVAQSILMSVLVTLRQNGQDALTFISRQLRSRELIALPLPAG
jgi:transposase